MKKSLSMFLCALSLSSIAQTTITVNATQNITPISPWIYGRNNNLSDNPSSPTSSQNWQLYKDAGLRFYRENGGNNCTKYNWRLKLSSHPDWFNNVYLHNWDYSANSLLSNTSNTQGMYALQVLGKVASNTTNNFSDWAYTQAGSPNGGPSSNYAGGGGPIAFGGNGGTGNPALYLKDWSADSTVGILNHWFNNLNYNSDRLQYWNMDNEPDIWDGTHDDVVTSAVAAEDFMQRYFAVAKAARAKFPNIKLVGFVGANEWQWYSGATGKISYKSKSYTWIEYFILRIAEEQQSSGIRLLDVLDVHFYPGTQSDVTTTLDLHRVWFDKNYDYPKANGVKLDGPSGWNSGNTKEYFFARCNDWLTTYIGSNHGVKFGVSEYGDIANTGSENPNVVACSYAATLGEFATQGVELFSPWNWYKGQWEVMHLFSNYYGTFSNQATSSNLSQVAAFSSLNAAGDSLMIALVNKNQSASSNVDINIQNFVYSDSTVDAHQLANLPNTETFVSAGNNALQTLTYTISNGKIQATLPKLSVTMIVIPSNQNITTSAAKIKKEGFDVNVFPNPANNQLFVQGEENINSVVSIYNQLGEKMGEWNCSGKSSIDISNLASGTYTVKVYQSNACKNFKVVKM